MHLIDILLIILLVCAIAGAIRVYRTNGSCSCGGSCEGCAARSLTGCEKCKNRS